MLKITRGFVANRKENESGAAMIFALMVMVVALVVSVLVAGYVLTNITITKGVNSISTNGLAADAAISNALLVANSVEGKNLLAAHDSPEYAVTGQLAANASPNTVKWRWYAEKVAGTGQRIYYYIYATGYTKSATDEDAKTTRVLLSSKNVSSASMQNGKIVYQPSDQAVHQWGIAGLNNITLGASAKIYSYDSYQNRNPTGATEGAEVATNGNLILGGDNSLRKFNKFAASNNVNRCVGTGCDSLQVDDIAYQLSLSSVAAKVQEQCPLAASSYPSWTASANSGLLTVTSTNKCFNTMDFNANTTLPASATPNTPAQVFIKGNIYVRAGVTVNNGGAPASLQLYSQAGSEATFTPGTSGAPTKFFGLVAGPTLACSSAGTSGANLTLYGSLACGSVDFKTGSVIWNDDGAKMVKSTTDRVLWSISKYETVL